MTPSEQSNSRVKLGSGWRRPDGLKGVVISIDRAAEPDDDHITLLAVGHVPIGLMGRTLRDEWECCS